MLKEFLKTIKEKMTNEDFLKQLEPILMQLNMQNLSKVKQNQAQENGSNTSNGSVGVSDPIGALINQVSDQDALNAIADAPDVDNNVNTPDAPKTVGGQPQTGPSVVAPPSANTLVVQPTDQTNKMTGKYSPFTSSVTPDVVSKYTKEYGVPDSKVTEAILNAAKTTGSDADLLFKFAKAESRFDPTAKAGSSSATGLFQFLDKTWNYVMHPLGGKENFNLTGNRKDPYENAVAGAIYLNEIKKGLSKARPSGEFSPGELYMGHFAGPTTAANAIKLIDQGKGNLKADAVFSPAQIKANESIFYPVTYKKNSKGVSYGPAIINGPMRSLSQVLQTLSSRVS